MKVLMGSTLLRHETICLIVFQRSELPPPKSKRDYCIREMCDTERNYVDALVMIHEVCITSNLVL